MILDAPGCRKWWFCLAVSVGAIVATWWPDGLLLLRYDRAQLMSGQAWRVLSAHLVHLNGTHLLLNLLGLILICELLWHEMPLSHGAALFAVAGLGVCGLLWWLHPELTWYAGLSGALHGLWAGCALTGLWTRNAQKGRWSSWSSMPSVPMAGLLLLAAKLLFEFWNSGPGNITVGTADLPVVTVAHRHGALSGLAWVLAWHLIRNARDARLK